MSKTKDLTVLAVGLAAGLYTEDTLLEELGDDSLVAKVVALAGGSAVGGIAAGVTKTILDTDIVDDVYETVDDVVDSINPFNL